MANLIEQSDNTVIDFTVISEMISAVNSMNNRIQEIEAKVGLTSSSSAKQTFPTIQAGHQAFTSADGKSVTVKFPTPFTSTTGLSVVGTVMYNGGTPIMCYLPKSLAKEQVVFATSASVPAGKTAYIYWVAIQK